MSLLHSLHRAWMGLTLSASGTTDRGSHPLSSVDGSANASATTISSTATQTSSTLGPTPTDTVAGCEQFYTTTDSDDWATVETKFDITLEQFYRWNPRVGSTCTNLWIGESYYVMGPTSTSTNSATVSALTQTGIASNCNKYYTVVAKD
jgi:hypothetical protein